MYHCFGRQEALAKPGHRKIKADPALFSVKEKISIHMEQMKIDELAKVHIDYEDDALPEVVKELRPVVFAEGTDYCCLLGPDRQRGIVGCGHSVVAAIADWEKSLQRRLENPDENDEVAQYVKDSLNASNKKVW